MTDWAQVNTWDSSSDLTTRVRRLERGQQYLRGGQLVTPSGQYAGIPVSLLDNGNITLTSPDLVMSGSIPPFGVIGNFGFSATSSSITVYYDGTNSSVLLQVVRADGSVQQLPTGSLTVNGLTASTMYGFLPFWSTFVNCGIGFVKGDSGTPQFAFSSAAQTIANSIQQNYQGREALTRGFITYSTTSSGGSSGTGSGMGGGGGDGSCIMLGTDIEPMGDNSYSTEHKPQSEWVRLSLKGYPRSLNCTPNHPLYHPEKGQLRADGFKEGDWLITEQGERRIALVKPFRRVCTKVKVLMPSGHLFFANGFLSHNAKYV